MYTMSMLSVLRLQQTFTCYSIMHRVASYIYSYFFVHASADKILLSKANQVSCHMCTVPHA